MFDFAVGEADPHSDYFTPSIITNKIETKRHWPFYLQLYNATTKSVICWKSTRDRGVKKQKNEKNGDKKAVLLPGEPRNTAVNSDSDTYRNLQRGNLQRGFQFMAKSRC